MKVVPPDDDAPRVSRPGALSRDELITLVEGLQRAEGSEAEQDEALRRFRQSVPHPRAADLIYWPQRQAAGSFAEMTATEVVDAALSYRAIELGP
jgi:hypothetical protein